MKKKSNYCKDSKINIIVFYYLFLIIFANFIIIFIVNSNLLIAQEKVEEKKVEIIIGIVETIKLDFVPSTKFIIGSDSIIGISAVNRLDKTISIKSIEKLDLEELNLNEPGNMNYFIRLKEKKEEEMVLWSNMDSAPTELVTFYKNTIKGLKTEAIQ